MEDTLKSLIFASLIVMSSCGHLKNRVVGLDKSVVNSKPSYDELVSSWGKPDQCQQYFEKTYCGWQYEMVTFKNKKFLNHKTLNGEFFYETETQSMSLDENTKKKIYLVPGSKDLNQDGIEWRENIKYVQAVLSSRGFIIVPRMKDSEQIVIVNFGISEKLSRVTFSVGYHWPGMNDSRTELLNRRFLSLTAIETEPYLLKKKQIEIWKVHSSSIGGSGDISRAVPFLARTSEDFIAKKSEGIVKGEMREDSVFIHALREAVKDGSWPASEEYADTTPAKI